MEDIIWSLQLKYKMEHPGLAIDETQFSNMTGKEQNLILFKNILNLHKKFDDSKKKDSSYILNKKIQYYWLSGLTAVFFGYLGIKQKLGL